MAELDPREIQQIFDEPGQPIQLRFHTQEILEGSLIGPSCHTPLEQGRKALETRDRRSQLVAGHGKKLIAQTFQAFALTDIL